SQYATLETAWAFRVVGQPSFHLELSHIRLLAVDAHDGDGDGELRASADLRIRAFLLRGASASDVGQGGSSAQLFFDTDGAMELVGEGQPLAEDCTLGCPPIPTYWELQPSVHGEALTALWRTDDEGNPLIDQFELDLYPVTPYI